MRHGIKISLLIFLFFCHRNSFSLEFPTNGFFGNASVSGCVKSYRYLDGVNLGSVTVPIAFVFSSDSQKSSSFLGSHWELPVFESFAVKSDEDSITVLAPWGETAVLFLKREGLNAGCFQSKYASDLSNRPKWKGREVDKNTFECDVEGFGVIRYKNGLIASYKGKKTDNYIWVRNGSEIRIVGDAVSQKVAASIIRVSPTESVIKTNGREYKVSLRFIPWFKSFALEGVSESLAAKILVEYPAPDKVTISEGELQSSYTWDVGSGTILEDDASSYAIKIDDKMRINEATRTYKTNGYKETLHIDYTAGSWTIKDASGLQITTKFFLSFVPGKVRNQQVMSNKLIENERFMSYDNSGRLSRILDKSADGNVRQAIYNEEGQLQELVTKPGR